MDMLFFFVACLGLAETIDLFMGKDFLIFMGDKMDEKDYDLPKIFAVEKWLFAADTIGCFMDWLLGTDYCSFPFVYHADCAYLGV